jgi:hypothetical protein
MMPQAIGRMEPIPFHPVGYNERNDCAVRALYLASGMPYQTAYSLCEQAGRKPNRGFNNVFYYLLLGAHGFEERPHYTGLYLGHAIRNMREGRFILYVRNHFFAVINGAVYDQMPQGPRRRVKWCYALSPSHEK